ncbi:LOW QUALITY PROTEIN: cytochrome b-c1 complex subunit 7-like [Manduca sexta]|uniref:cytochrome b-c1 complex subunit 7 n=1 Tax=Manduca sexta TaxID=7130 RepID=UPI0011843A37|nr:cytochrome b-c1 complex subunit 7 [Manduca sexta]XP_037301468.1 LOW QUALITY PROTEIN: cytochrome b-c1 complex subunit 7-like [Manduca sexta]
MAFRATAMMAFRATPVVRSSLNKWAYNLAGFNKYGLLRDDCLHETPDVQEALRRLPQHIVDERNFRIVRALQLSLQKTVLPKEEWTKFEEDKLYLTPIVDQVKKERLEKENWEKEY